MVFSGTPLLLLNDSRFLLFSQKEWFVFLLLLLLCFS